MSTKVALRMPPPDPAHLQLPAPRLAPARDALASWLLNSGVQQRRGRHAGAIAGWISADGRADYLYPEITGYYLQWLASYAMRDGSTSEIVERAAAAQRWLCVWAASDVPPTRIYLRRHGDDWRNGALFVFDLAMVLRGLAWASRARLVQADGTLVSRLCAHLSRLIGADGLFDACVAGRSETALPARWSTRRGGYLTKAASGVIFAAGELAQVPKSLARCADASFVSAMQAAINQPHAESHPMLYAIEGALSLPCHPGVASLMPTLIVQVDDLLERTRRRGGVPESRNADGRERLDLVAQTLRACVLLAARQPGWTPDESTMTKMLRTLAFGISSAGIPFCPRDASTQYNAWTAMFAEQALAFASCDRASQASDPQPCIV